MSRYYLLFVLNLPLISEVVRKYVVQDELVFLAADVVALLTLFVLLTRGKLPFRLTAPFYFLALAFVGWVFVQQAISGRSFGVFAIGARATFFPFVYLYLSAYFLSRYEGAIRLLFLCATLWVFAAGAMAVMQIHLGADHPINAVWGRQSMGIGDYANANREGLMKGLFRPTSIFTHTGKFGQVAFLLVLFRWTAHWFSGALPKWVYVFVPIDLLTIAVSGQRAAFIFLLGSVVAMSYLSGRLGGKAIARVAVGTLIAALIIGGFIALVPNYGTALLARFEGGFHEIPERLEGNLVSSMWGILNHYLVTGEGFGYFTFGSHLFGGKIVYEELKAYRLGESSLIRLSAEVGLVGALVLTTMLLTVVLQAVRAFRTRLGTFAGASALFFALWILSLLAWCNTADVFANTVATFFGSALSGGVLLRPGRANMRSGALEPTSPHRLVAVLKLGPDAPHCVRRKRS